MKRTVSLKLAPTAEQAALLSALQTEFASACNAVVPFARDHRCWNRVALHHLAYYKVREAPPLGSQMICNAIKAVADSYKGLKLRKADEVPTVVFKPAGAVHFDARTYTLRDTTLSLYTLAGRIHLRMQTGEFQSAYLARSKPKEAQLVRRNRQWFFNLVLDLPDTPTVSSGSVIGVDLGENHLASTSTQRLFGGGKLRHHRDEYRALHRRLQANGSQSARQLLRKVSGRERRHVTHTNHEVSKAIVAEAVQVGASAIVMEDLTHIRKPIQARRRERTRLHRWAWQELQGFVEYKAEAAGLRVVYVDPAYSSQTCSGCGGLGRRVKHRFSCVCCGLLTHSDWNASRNLVRIAPLSSDASGAVTLRHVAA
jgi:IS605 OrfB family transposase